MWLAGETTSAHEVQCKLAEEWAVGHMFDDDKGGSAVPVGGEVLALLPSAGKMLRCGRMLIRSARL